MTPDDDAFTGFDEEDVDESERLANYFQPPKSMPADLSMFCLAQQAICGGLSTTAAMLCFEPAQH